MPRRKDRANSQTNADNGSPLEPLINRVLELDLFREHLRRVISGESGYAAVMLGESGVGKSRLAQEVQVEARNLGIKTISIQCLGRGAEPLLPFKEGLAAYLGRSPERIRETLASAAPLLLDAVPFIGTFLGKVGERLAGTSTSMKGLYEELARILTRIAGETGLSLLVEDLHATDPDTLYFLNYLLHKIKDYPVLVIVTIQLERLNDNPEVADLVAQWTAGGYGTLTVVPLERAHVGEYVQRTAAQGRPADEETVDRLFRLTGGNPFFLRETLSLLAEMPERRINPETIPPRADAILRRRLAKADENTLQFMRAASVVLETTQELEPIVYVMESETKHAIAALDSACELRLMREGSQGEVSFVHSLMQREVYADMGENQRRYLHRRAGEWLERQTSLASAAFHYEQAHSPDDMVRAGLAAAEQAEQAGMYHTALMLYQKIRPYMKIEELGPRLGQALIVLGDWDEAEELTRRLPEDDGRVRLLRSQLQFVRGNFDAAKADAQKALESRSADRIQTLIRLADIDLYLGDFSSAQRHGHAALKDAIESGSDNLHARCLGIVAATEFFGGDIDTAHTRYSNALELLKDVPEDNRDRTIYTTILGNLGNVAEAKKDWATAERYHREALRLRREVADTRSVLHSLHALGRTRIELGDQDGGHGYIAEAEQLAADLDETLERAKIWHTQAEQRLRDGDCETAQRLVTASLENFTTSRTQYDVAHASLTLSAATLACGQERQSIEHGAAARSSIEAMGYGLLCHLHPDVAYGLGERIAGALTAYAYGDAFGVPWEGRPPTDVTPEEIERLPAREGWPRGTTSDDTALTLLTARHLAERDGSGDARAFLADLAVHAPSIRGLGPSTTAAIEHFHQTGEIPSAGGATNGAAMRALPVGWVIPHDQAERRRLLAVEMSRATHPDPTAQVAACVIAACASWALEGAQPGLLLQVAIEEAVEAARAVNTPPRLTELLSALSEGRWQVPQAGVSLDPNETVAAVLSCVTKAPSLRSAIVNAVQLGGDTDTVAALVGSLLGSQLTPDQVRTELPWHQAVMLPEPDIYFTEVSDALATTRAVLSG
jgi:ADP-ribosylglycohydrolase/tetratricopeptide (TPR) repeat protein